MPKNKKYIFFLMIIATVGVVAFFKGGLSLDAGTGPLEGGISVKQPLDDAETGRIFVHVSGEVNNAGVYELPLGSRVFEAVEMAGGTTTRAAVYMVNQAEILEDGAHIHFQSIVQDEHQESGLVNLNTATVEELMTLSGIGEAKANSIIRYRQDNGYFKSIEEVMEISGIKEAVFNQIKDFVTIY